jgi:hypothetical protein
MPQPAIAPQIHQPLNAHRDLPPQIALDRVFAVDQLTDSQHLVIRQLMHSPLGRNADLAAYFKRLGRADAMDVGQPDRDPLLIGDIDASDPRHLRFSFKDQK